MQRIKKQSFETRTHRIIPSRDHGGYIFTNKKTQKWFFLGASETYIRDQYGG